MILAPNGAACRVFNLTLQKLTGNKINYTHRVFFRPLRIDGISEQGMVIGMGHAAQIKIG